jgi:hypothetical protein
MASKLEKAVVAAALAAAGIVVVVANTPADQEVIRGKVTISADGVTYGLLEATADQCAALVACDGCDPGADDCADDHPDGGFVAPAAGSELRRTLACLKRDDLIHAFHATTAPAGEPCSVSVMLLPHQGADWLSHLDADSVAVVDEKPSKRPARFKRGGGRSHVWAGQDPLEE